MKIYVNKSAHMTKMATMPINGKKKTTYKISFDRMTIVYNIIMPVAT